MSSDPISISVLQNSSPEIAKTAVHCYFAAMLAMAQAAADICPHIGTPYQNGLVRLRRRLAFETTPHNLIDSLTALETDLAAFARRANEYYSLKSADVAGLLEVLSTAIVTFETRDSLYLEPLSLAVRQMENALPNCAHPEDLRGVYQHQLAQLCTFSERLAADSKNAFAKLRNETIVMKSGCSAPKPKPVSIR